MEYPKKEFETNLGTPEGKRCIRRSLLTFGPLRSICVDKNNKVICGNKVLDAAQELNLNVVYVDATKDTLVVVRRTDMDITEPITQEAAVVENLCSEKDLNWNCTLISQKTDIVPDLLGRFEAASCVIPLIDLADFFDNVQSTDCQMELL